MIPLDTLLAEIRARGPVEAPDWDRLTDKSIDYVISCPSLGYPIPVQAIAIRQQRADLWRLALEVWRLSDEVKRLRAELAKREQPKEAPT